MVRCISVLMLSSDGVSRARRAPHLHFEMRENNAQFNPLLLLPNPQMS